MATVWSVREPSDDRIRRFLTEQATLEHTYPAVGRTLRLPGDLVPTGYDPDHERTLLGRGRETFEAACRAIARWEMFPPGWTRVTSVEGAIPPLARGTTVAMMVRAFGLWWVNACRIVYVVETSPRSLREEGVRRFGFAYGTLPGHVERGEERFMVEWRADDTVWYDLFAFSRPRSPVARIGYPAARLLQWRFRKASSDAMRRAVLARVGFEETCLEGQ